MYSKQLLETVFYTVVQMADFVFVLARKQCVFQNIFMATNEDIQVLYLTRQKKNTPTCVND